MHNTLVVELCVYLDTALAGSYDVIDVDISMRPAEGLFKESSILLWPGCPTSGR